MNIAVLISGGGTTMEQVALACQSGRINGKVVLVISSNSSAGGLERAKALQIPTAVLRLHHDFNGSSESFGRAIINACSAVQADLIAQLGWLAFTPENVLEAFPGMIVNQHNAPLDPGRLGFGGKGMHGLASHAAVLYFARRVRRPFPTEATVHRVTSEYDNGSLLGVRPMQIETSDTAVSLASRLLPIEHGLVIDTLAHFADGKVHEVARVEPLIWQGEESLFHQAVAYATSTQH